MKFKSRYWETRVERRPRKGAWIEIQIEVLGNPSGASPPQGGVD